MHAAGFPEGAFLVVSLDAVLGRCVVHFRDVMRSLLNQVCMEVNKNGSRLRTLFTVVTCKGDDCGHV